MMSRYLIALPISLALLSACGESPDKSDKLRHEEVCPGSNPGQKVVVITYVDPASHANPKPKVNKDRLEVHEGDKIKFILNGPDQNIVVSTSGKTPEDGWLNGGGVKNAGNPGSERFYVCVPRGFIDWDQVEPACDGQKCRNFEYDVLATGHETLDPVVTVQEF